MASPPEKFRLSLGAGEPSCTSLRCGRAHKMDRLHPHCLHFSQIVKAQCVAFHKCPPACAEWAGAHAQSHRYNAGVKVPNSRHWKPAVEAVLYLLVLIVFISKAAGANFSHDENQFIAPGQLLAYHALLPYVDYPYTHMPYAVLFYGIGAAATPYDFLAGRLLNAVAWFVCALVIVKGFGRLTSTDEDASALFLDFVVLCIFVLNTILEHIAGNALNHSFAALFSLLALAFFVRKGAASSAATRAAFGTGAFASLAAWTRFNYAILLPVLAGLYVVEAWRSRAPRRFRSAIAYAAGAVTGSIPVLGLFVAAPQAFLYGNYVYIRLNTIYYSGLLTRLNMQLGQKLLDFLGYVGASPLDLVLYLAMFFMLARAVVQIRSHCLGRGSERAGSGRLRPRTGTHGLRAHANPAAVLLGADSTAVRLLAAAGATGVSSASQLDPCTRNGLPGCLVLCNRPAGDAGIARLPGTAIRLGPCASSPVRCTPAPVRTRRPGSHAAADVPPGGGVRSLPVCRHRTFLVADFAAADTAAPRTLRRHLTR